MSDVDLERRVRILEEKMDQMRDVPRRLDAVESQILELRSEMRIGFSALRTQNEETRAEMRVLNEETRADARALNEKTRAEMRALNEETRAEMRALNDDTKAQMRLLHEDVISRIALLQENRARPAPRRRRPKKGD